MVQERNGRGGKGGLGTSCNACRCVMVESPGGCLPREVTSGRKLYCRALNRGRRFMGRGAGWLGVSEGHEVGNALCWKYSLWL